jgi:hypothetical protein
MRQTTHCSPAQSLHYQFKGFPPSARVDLKLRLRPRRPLHLWDFWNFGAVVVAKGILLHTETFGSGLSLALLVIHEQLPATEISLILTILIDTLETNFSNEESNVEGKTRAKFIRCHKIQL